ncbi:MAG: hypothetical protein LBR60_05710 [Fibrobacter sp.]|jgi:hypothetical protein|nr:hypothetical protein [Fibrobacter sp.]
MFPRIWQGKFKKREMEIRKMKKIIFILLAILSTTIFAAQRVCGDRVYDDTEQYCFVRDYKLYLYSYEYCGKIKYKPVADDISNPNLTCIKGKVLPRCGDDGPGYNPKTHDCTGGIVRTNEEVEKMRQEEKKMWQEEEKMRQEEERKKQDSIQNLKNSLEKFTDSRDGKIYSSKKLGENTWMLENLNYEVRPGKCYNNDCEKYGWGYPWENRFQDENMKYSYIYANDLCPNGWRLPNNADWENLKAVWTEAKNYFLFDESRNSYWWSFTEYEEYNGSYAYSWYVSSDLLVNKHNPKNTDFAIRCVKGQKQELKNKKEDEKENKSGLGKLKFW